MIEKHSGKKKRAMNDKTLLTLALKLLYREAQLASTDNSADLVRKIVEVVKVADIGASVNTLGQAIDAMKAILIEMCDLPKDHAYTKTDILQRVRLAVGEDDRWYDAIFTTLDLELSEEEALKEIVVARNSLNNHFREKEIAEVLSKASVAMNFKRDSIKNISDFLLDVKSKLDNLDVSNGYKDPAIIDEIDISNEKSLTDLFDAEGEGGDAGVYSLGWQGLNRMMQGGPRQGEFINYAALQHKYKTGLGLTVFRHFAIYNKPKTKDPKKKPLLLRISFEDKLVENLRTLYLLCKYNETREYIDISKVSVEEMRKTILECLGVNGWNIKMIRMDPTQCTYKSVLNKVLEYEAQGYAVEAFFPDYIGMIPTTGCVTTGPIGTDMRDLIRRFRNFFAPRRAVVFNPHQLSTDAKGLIRGGIPEDKFVKEIEGKGYYSGSKQLDQEFDMEIFIHLFHYKREAYLSVQRGKHRVSTIIEDESDKYFLMKFPWRMPIPDDVGGEDMSLQKLGQANTGPDDDFFA